MRLTNNYFTHISLMIKLITFGPVQWLNLLDLNLVLWNILTQLNYKLLTYHMGFGK